MVQCCYCSYNRAVGYFRLRNDRDSSKKKKTLNLLKVFNSANKLKTEKQEKLGRENSFFYSSKSLKIDVSGDSSGIKKQKKTY